MKIDLHCHTKNEKSGDTTREVSDEAFFQKITSQNVEIVAITNHNHFDVEQFQRFSKILNGKSQVWPGIELDVYSNITGIENHGHVILVTDPSRACLLNENSSVFCGNDPDKTHVDINQLITFAKAIKPCVISCHYRKEPALSHEDIKYLKTQVDDDSVVVLEPAKARKAGIIINADKENCWFGSDVTDWNDYPGKDLPDCKFNLTSFQSFVDLLKKNQDAVLLQTFLNTKGPEFISVSPFSDLNLTLPLYKDTNIVFGGKATGKTEILKSIETCLRGKGKTVETFYIEEKSEDFKTKVDYKPSPSELAEIESNNCENNFAKIQNWSCRELPLLADFYEYAKLAAGHEAITRFKISEASFSDVIEDDKFIETKKDLDGDILKLQNVLTINLSKGLNQAEIVQLESLLSKLLRSLIDDFFKGYFANEAKKLEKFTINHIKKAIAARAGTTAKPSSCGLSITFEDFKSAQTNLSAIQSRFGYQKILDDVLIGTLPSKGDVLRRTSIGFEPQPQTSDVPWKRHFQNDGCNTKSFSTFKSQINETAKHCNTLDLIPKMKNLQAYLQQQSLNSLSYFKNYSTRLVNGANDDFKPSNGETTILLVDNAISCKNADAIVLDEPDSGMGADFINDDLLTKINTRAAEDQIIIVLSTHDPNLVVRTHPYSVIYREEYSPNKYKTYLGSSFEEYMVNPNDKNDKKEWIEACIKKCEGGMPALKERERTYGEYE